MLSGLPASGKSSLAKLIAKEYNAFYLRIDTIEQGLRDVCNVDVQAEGYRLAYRIARDNSELGLSVVADSCNPIHSVRREWEEVAEQSRCPYINIEVICSDKSEHKRRCETRNSEVTGLQLPSWDEIQERTFDPWDTHRIVIDTANKSIEDSFTELQKEMEKFIFSRQQS